MLSARVRILAWVALLLAFAGASALLLQRRVLHDRLKQALDPLDILNPGKFL